MTQVAVAVAVLLLIGAHVLAWGLLGYRLVAVRLTDPVAVAASVGCLGVTLFGAELLLLGHLHWLTPAALVLGAAIAAAGVAVRLWRVRPRLAYPTARVPPLAAAAVVAMLALVVVSGVRPPLYPDEREYHWPAPLLWASHAGWVASPYRHTNGPILMHAIYTAAALWQSSTAAHWSHSVLLGCLLLSAAALARAAGASGIVTAAVCLSVPAIVNQSSVAYTDVAAAALALGAYVPILCRRPPRVGQAPLPWGHVVASGVLLAGAFSVKPFVVVAAPVAFAYVVWARRQDRRQVATGAGLFLLPILAAAAFWSMHTHALVGRWWDTQGIMVRDESSPAWQFGWAVGRIPTLRDLAWLPLIPLVVPVLGQQEPYGGRIGPVFLLAWLVIGWYFGWYWWGRHRKSTPPQDDLPWLAAGAVVYFLALAPFLVKTRFHDFVWAASAVVAVVAWSRLRDSVRPPVGRAVSVLFTITIGLGMFDASRNLVRGLITPFH